MPDVPRTHHGSRKAAAFCTRVAIPVVLLIVAGGPFLGCSLIAGLQEFDDAIAQGPDSAPTDGSFSSTPFPVPSDGGDSLDGSALADENIGPSQGMPEAQVGATIDDGPQETAEASADLADGADEPSVTDSAYAEGAPDAGPDAPDSSPVAPDANRALPDAGMEAEVAVEAGADALARDAGTWCASHATTNTSDCHDFDEGQQPQTGFSSHYYTGRYASVTLVDFAPGSPPASLLVSTPMLNAGAQPQDEQFNDVVAFHTKVELSFAVKIVNYDANAGYLSLFRFSFQNGTWALELDLQQQGATFSESSTLPDGGTKRSVYAAAQPSPLNAWTNVDCLIDFGQHTISMSYGGVPVVNSQTITNPAQSKLPGIFVQIGLNYLVAPAKPMMIYYDDILLGTPP